MGQGSSTGSHRGSFLPPGGHDGGEDDGGMEMGPQERPYGPTRKGAKKRILKNMLTVHTNNPVSVRGGFGPGLKANKNFTELLNERALHHDMCGLIESGTSLTHRGHVANKKGNTSSKNSKNRLKAGKTAAAAGESAVDETLVRVLQKKIVNSESEYAQHALHDLSIRKPLMEDLLTEFGYYHGLAEAELAGQGRAFRYEAAASIIINSYNRRPIDAHRLDRQSLREITWLQGVGFHTIAGWCVFLHCLLFFLEWPQLGGDAACRDMGETHCTVILGLAGNTSSSSSSSSSFDMSNSECYPKFEMGNTAAMIIELLFGVVHVLEAFFQLRHRTGRLWGGQRVNFVWIKVRKEEGNDTRFHSRPSIHSSTHPPTHLYLPAV